MARLSLLHREAGRLSKSPRDTDALPLANAGDICPILSHLSRNSTSLTHVSSSTLSNQQPNGDDVKMEPKE